MPTSRLKSIVFALVPVLLLFAAIEGAAQIYWLRLKRQALSAVRREGEDVLRNDAINFMKVLDPVLGYRLAPNLNVPASQVVTTAQGFFQREPVAVERRPQSLRIMVLGDSPVMGHDVDRGSFPTDLRRLVAQHAAGYPGGTEVINTGVPGWVSDQSAIWSETELAAYRPDVIVLYVGLNDFGAYSPCDEPETQSYFERYYGDSARFAVTPRLKSLVLAQALAVKLLPRLASQPPVRPNLQAASRCDRFRPEDTYKFFFRSLDRIVHAFRERAPGVRVVLSTLVGRWPMDTPEQFDKGDGRTIWMKPEGISRQQAADLLEKFNDAIRRYAAAHALVTADMARDFAARDRQRLLWSYAHMTNEGYEILAERLFTVMLNEHLIQGDPIPAR